MSNPNVFFSTKLPFHKLDMSKLESFQIINLTFDTEPTDPATPSFGDDETNSTTLVHQFAHGYDYVPSTWFLISVDGFTNTKGPEGTVIFLADTGIIGTTGAIMRIEVDSTYVKFYVDKWWGYVMGAVDPPPHIQNMVVSIRSYIFVEDLLGNSVPA